MRLYSSGLHQRLTHDCVYPSKELRPLPVQQSGACRVDQHNSTKISGRAMIDKIDRVFVDGWGLPVVLRGVTDDNVIIEDRLGIRMMSLASFRDRYEEMP